MVRTMRCTKMINVVLDDENYSSTSASMEAAAEVSTFASVYLTGQNTRTSPKWYSNEAKLLIIPKI
jgi:hypothetical protein